MVQINENQISGITELDEEGTGTVTTNGADLIDVAAVNHEAQASAPATGADKGAFWVEDGSPTLPKFTNSAGLSITLGQSVTPPSVGQDGYVAIANGGDINYISASEDGYVLTWSTTNNAWEAAPASGGGGGANTWADVLASGALSGGVGNNPTLQGTDILTSTVGDELIIRTNGPDDNIIIGTLIQAGADNSADVRLATGQTDTGKSGNIVLAVGFSNNIDPLNDGYITFDAKRVEIDSNLMTTPINNSKPLQIQTGAMFVDGDSAGLGLTTGAITGANNIAGNLDIFTPDLSTATQSGGTISVVPGDVVGGAFEYGLTLGGGNSVGSGTGRATLVTAGSGFDVGGFVEIRGGSATGSDVVNGDGGPVVMFGGDGYGTGDGGNAGAVSGNGGETGSGGEIVITTGSGGSTSGDSGRVLISTTNAQNGNSGNIDIFTGLGPDNTLGTSGNIQMYTGSGSAGTGSFDTGSIDIFTGGPANQDGYSGEIQIATGSANSGIGSGDLRLATGNTDSGFFSGDVNIETGTAGSGNAGGINLLTGGNSPGTGNSGDINIQTGFAGGGSSGDITIESLGNGGNGGNTGDITLRTGNPGGGNPGDILIETGAASNPVPTGAITIKTGNTNNANSDSSNVEIRTGTSDQEAGNVLLQAGTSSAGGTGGIVSVNGGKSTSGTGNVQILAGAGAIGLKGGGVTIANGIGADSGSGDVTFLMSPSNISGPTGRVYSRSTIDGDIVVEALAYGQPQ